MHSLRESTRSSLTTALVRVGTRAHVAAAAAILAVACATNPVTGQRQLALISESQEIELGRQAAEAAVTQIGLVDDPALQAYVERLGTAIARASERPDLPWTFGVVDDPTPNAFAAPGGYIYVTRGMLGLMRSEAELVGVLGHEVGHVTARHSVAMISRAQLAQIGLGIGAAVSPTIAALGDLAGGGLQLLFLRYGREAERQADDLGYRYMVEQGYDPRYMMNMFVSLQRVGEAEGRSPVPAWMSTHPYPDERIRRIESRIAQTPPPAGLRVGADEYLARIDGLVYGENPRNGFFHEQLYMHPELRFRINFPTGWRTRNTAQAVLAGSPQQDAVMQLALAQGSVQEAAAAFFGQQGMNATNVAETRVNGLPAVAGQFSARTQDGHVVAGRALFVARDAHTFGILGYTLAERLAQYDAAFATSLGSFNRLTDPQALAVQPNRLRITRLPRTMSLAEFDAQYPSAVDHAELALINHVESPDHRLPAGYPIKRVSR
jgi:predicted Zn-dependent protease